MTAAPRSPEFNGIVSDRHMTRRDVAAVEEDGLPLDIPCLRDFSVAAESDVHRFEIEPTRQRRDCQVCWLCRVEQECLAFARARHRPRPGHPFGRGIELLFAHAA